MNEKIKWEFNYCFKHEEMSGFIICRDTDAEKKGKELIKNTFKKEPDEWLEELSKVSSETFFGMTKMNGDIQIGILIHSGKYTLPSVKEVQVMCSDLLVEGMNRDE